MDSVLSDWYRDINKKVAGNKQGFMHADRFKFILKEFASSFNCIKPLCRKLRSILFPLIKDEELDLETSADLNILYKPFIKAFNDVIAGLEADS